MLQMVGYSTELVEEDIINVTYCPGGQMVADTLIKANRLLLNFKNSVLKWVSSVLTKTMF